MIRNWPCERAPLTFRDTPFRDIYLCTSSPSQANLNLKDLGGAKWMKCMLFILSLWHFLGHFFSHDFNLIHFSNLLHNVLLFHWVKELLKARVRQCPFPPTTLWFCGLLWWFVMISMDDNIHHVHVFRPCSPGFLARGLCESESCGMVLYFLWSS